MKTLRTLSSSLRLVIGTIALTLSLSFILDPRVYWNGFADNAKHFTGSLEQLERKWERFTGETPLETAKEKRDRISLKIKVKTA